MSKRIITKVGDIFEVSLTGCKKAYAQLTIRSRNEGDLLQVFDYIVPQEKQVDILKVVDCRLLFPPMFTSVIVGIKQGLWRKIGNHPVKQVIYPDRLYTLWKSATGEASNWLLVLKDERISLGWRLPEKYKNLDFAALYSPDLIIKRIETGERPYDSLIRKNILKIKN